MNTASTNTDLMLGTATTNSPYYVQTPNWPVNTTTWSYHICSCREEGVAELARRLRQKLAEEREAKKEIQDLIRELKDWLED